jgi:hypothetical protein
MPKRNIKSKAEIRRQTNRSRERDRANEKQKRRKLRTDAWTAE